MVPFATAAAQNHISSTVGAIFINKSGFSISFDKEFGGYKTPPTPVCKFLKLGLKLNHQNKSKPSHLTNKVIVITGKLSKYSREDLKGRLELMGAKVTNSVSAKTDFLIAGEDSGSKLSKANELNIKIISDENLESFIDKT